VGVSSAKERDNTELLKKMAFPSTGGAIGVALVPVYSIVRTQPRNCRTGKARAGTPANGAGLDGFFGWVLIRVLLDGWKRVTL